MPRLARKLPLIAVIAAALCNVIGGGVNVLIAEIQHEIPGINDYVPLAVLIGGIIAFLISLVYAAISTAMPRAGGGYLYVSRSISPGWGFLAGFLKWMGSIIALGTVAYMDVLIAATAFHYLGITNVESFLLSTPGKIIGSLAIIWFFWAINYFGVRKYAYTVMILAALMILGGIFIMAVGFTHSHEDYLTTTSSTLPEMEATKNPLDVLYAAAVLFWAYIGFSSISQSGGEIENPKKNLPIAFLATSVLVAIYYFFYSLAFYHAVPWQIVATTNNPNVPQMIGVFLPKEFAVIITLFVFLALANDIPPMLYTKSRLFYSWAVDGIIPKIFEKTNAYKVPHLSLTFVAAIASLVAIGCALGGFFTEVDVVVISRFLLYTLIALALINLKNHNPNIYKNISFMKDRKKQLIISTIVVVLSLGLFLLMAYKDITSGKEWWKLSTVQTLTIALIGGIIYWDFVRRMKKKGVDYRKIFEKLPPE